jgi:hypothetical protein
MGSIALLSLIKNTIERTLNFEISVNKINLGHDAVGRGTQVYFKKLRFYQFSSMKTYFALYFIQVSDIGR